MKPEEQTALEALAGRALAPEEIEQIDEWLPERRDDLIAERLSIGRVRLHSAEITPRGAAAKFPALGGLPGPLALQKALRQLTAFAEAAKAAPVETTSLLGEAIEEQVRGFRVQGLDFSTPALRGMLDLIAAHGGISAEQAAGFKALAQEPDPLSTDNVSDALNRAQGLMTMGG